MLECLGSVVSLCVCLLSAKEAAQVASPIPPSLALNRRMLRQRQQRSTELRLADWPEYSCWPQKQAEEGIGIGMQNHFISTTIHAQEYSSLSPTTILPASMSIVRDLPRRKDRPRTTREGPARKGRPESA